MPVAYKTTQLQGITDLTVLARIKEGFVPGAFNAVTHVERLTRVLKVLNAVRQASREAALSPSPFADSVGRFRSIHFFRFAVVPPDHPGSVAADSERRHQLLLNVTFDGGWEPYMRLIWEPLGTLLDVIFCHCDGYPMAFRSRYDAYVRWVREHEIVSAFFYADSAATVADAHFLRAFEELQRRRGGRPDADLGAAGLALPAQSPGALPNGYAISSSLRVLKALDGLRDLFPTADDPHDGQPFVQDRVLLRFAQDLLPDLRSWIAHGLFDPGQAYDQLRASFVPEREWLMQTRQTPPNQLDRLTYDPRQVQFGIAERYPDNAVHGVLVLLRIQHVDAAQRWLGKETTVTPGLPVPPDGAVFRTVALTYQGLQRIGIPTDRLARLPREFIDGMEARAGLLGDLRGNHPEQWQRPRRNWPWQGDGADPLRPQIELATVHVLVQLRTALRTGEDDTDGTTALSRLLTEVAALATGEGLQVLFVQPMKAGSPAPGASVARNQFGFVDGISQPTLGPATARPTYWDDQVKPGDLFVGHANSRGDRPDPDGVPDPLTDNGSFLAVRKLRLFPERLEETLAKAATQFLREAGRSSDAAAVLAQVDAFKAKLLGRGTDGAPLVALKGAGDNDFDYRSDPDGAQCPFHSHVRRGNPRTTLPLQPAPRIARRGMSYVTPQRPPPAAAAGRGPPAAAPAAPAERGIVFMACNASLAEQFEVLQRWMAGGNSSGLSSTQSDPLLGVPEAGQHRIYRFVQDGEVVRLDLGDQPLAKLVWGLYALIPSLAALKAIADGIAGISDAPDVPKEDAPVAAPLAELETWRRRLEDEKVRAATWKTVRAAPEGVLDAGEYGWLVGTKASVLGVLQDDGSLYSVKGYGDRMKCSIGRGFLGMDDVGAHAGHETQAAHVNRIVESIGEETAYDAARGFAGAWLDAVLGRNQALSGQPVAPVDLAEFGRGVLADLCTLWFGLPDGALMKRDEPGSHRLVEAIPRCPGHLLTVSKYVFSPHPPAQVIEAASGQGKTVLDAVVKMLHASTKGQRELTPLVRKVIATDALKDDPELQARTVAGLMLGFPPTVLGNLVSVLIGWTEDKQLWELQQQLPMRVAIPYDVAAPVLREAFLRTMRNAPVPYAIWRTIPQAAWLDTPDRGDRPVVVGLGSAMDDGADDMLMFGGSRAPGSPVTTPHACPGYKMAMGVMLGCSAALLGRGTLRPTADPRVIVLADG